MPGANATANVAYHGTLQAATVDYVTIQSPCKTVTIVNRTGGSEIFFNVNQVANPAVNGLNSYIAPAAVGAVTVNANPNSSNTPLPQAAGQPAQTTGAMLIQLISTGTPTYTVEVLGD